MIEKEGGRNFIRTGSKVYSSFFIASFVECQCSFFSKSCLCFLPRKCLLMRALSLLVREVLVDALAFAEGELWSGNCRSRDIRLGN